MKSADTGAKGEHTLMFSLSLACPTREVLVGIGNRWGVADPAAIVSQVSEAAQGFASLAKKLKVKSAASIKQIAADIERRHDLLARP